MKLEKDFMDFVELLNNYDVNYMVVGGFALGFHGEPRTTGDLDIWIDRTKENAEKIVRVLNEFGMASLGFKAKDFLEPGIIAQIGQPPLRIDILNEIDGVLYSDAIKGNQFFSVGDLKIPFIGIEEFIKNKKSTGRKKDLADVKKIQAKAVQMKKTIKSKKKK